MSEIRVEEIDGRWEGHTVAGPQEITDVVKAAEDGLHYVAAGIIAEAIYLGTRPRAAVRESIRQGARDGVVMLEHLGTLGGDADQILDAVADEVEELLREDWSEVQGIARAVAKDGVVHLRATDG